MRAKEIVIPECDIREARNYIDTLYDRSYYQDPESRLNSDTLVRITIEIIEL